MARIFKNLVDYTPTFIIDMLVGGWYYEKRLVAWTQDRNILRITAPSGSAMATATITVTAGVGLPDQTTVTIDISFANSSVQHVDVTDVLRSVFDRTKKTQIDDTSTDGYILFQGYNSNGTPIGKNGSYESDIIYYDALVQAVEAGTCHPASDSWLLPDTFRIPSTNMCGNYLSQACTRMTRGANKLSVVDSNGVAIDSVVVANSDQLTYGFPLDPADATAVVRLSNGSSGLVEEARVLKETCGNDKVLLAWWSPAFGGWKSVMADVVGYGDDVSDSERYIIGWDYGEAKGGMLGMKVRIPNCTPRDYSYYRDIYYSAYVQMFDMALYDSVLSAAEIDKEVLVKGTPPSAKLTGLVDLDMTIMTAEVSSIW